MELSKLEHLLDKVIEQSKIEIMSKLEITLNESKELLLNSSHSLENEYDKIINEGKKESDKVMKQIIGSAELESRNKQILLINEYIEKAFDKAMEKLTIIKRDDDYSKLMYRLIDESINILGTSDIVIYTNSKDIAVVKPILPKFQGSEISSDIINCLGGIKVKSKDGSIVFDNTLDNRLVNMKPLIRKEIAMKFGVEN